MLATRLHGGEYDGGGGAFAWRAAQMEFFPSRLATGYVPPIPLPSSCPKVREAAL